MKTKKTLYMSYLLRLYGTVRPGEILWTASLDNPAGGEKMRFSSIEALARFLQDQCAGLESVEARGGGTEE